MSDICPECGKEYDVMGKHWYYNPSHRKMFSDGQIETLTGILMGDGYVTERGYESANPRFQLSMVNRKYLQYLDNRLGILSKGVKLEATAEQSAASNRRTGYRPNACTNNYHDLYILTTIAHPQLTEFAEWYNDGNKVWPKKIDLTPKTLKGWYVSDGTWKNHGSADYISFSAGNERGNQKKIDKYFGQAGLPLPNNYHTYETEEGGTNFNIEFSTADSKVLWDYMGDPLPGFEYKWPDR